MIITWQGGQNFILKTKGMNVVLGDSVKLGDLTITEPGEYEVGGVQLDWIDGVVQVYLEGLNLSHIKKGKVFSDDELEKLNGIDILLIGVGGELFTDTKVAFNIIAQIEPSIVIPMYGDNLDEFNKAEGAGGETLDEFKIAKADLQEDGRKIIILNAQFK